jgi:hypothetical protein
MDIRRNNPASPRGGKSGRSYRDLTAMRTAGSTPSSSASNSPQETDIPLPETGHENVTKLTMRKAKEEGEFETVPMGLGLDRGVDDRQKAE